MLIVIPLLKSRCYCLHSLGSNVPTLLHMHIIGKKYAKLAQLYN